MDKPAFYDGDDLEKWLDGRPHGDALAISSRSALRAVPFLGVLLEAEGAERRARIILPVFRSIAVADAARRGGADLSGAIRSAALSTDAAAHATRSAAQSSDAHSALAAVHSALAAIRSADSAAHAARSAAVAAARSADAGALAAGSAIRSPHAAARSAHADARSALWTTISNDARAIADGAIDDRALWHDAPPGDAAAHWIRLRDAILGAEGEGWDVWTDWYEARLRGDPVDAGLERAKALIPDAAWERGPKAANAEIRRLIAEHGAGKETPQAAAREIEAEE